MKEDKEDVNVQCFGKVNGCLVAHCNLAYYCAMATAHIKAQKEKL